MKIGITERGDAALSINVWKSALTKSRVDGAILITKSLTPAFREAVLDCFFNPVGNSKNIIVHCTCTGWGGTPLEPNVPDYKTQLEWLKELIDAGFPHTHCVLRIDPIIPTKKGLDRACAVLDYAEELGICCATRVSVYDEYKHVKERFALHGLKPVYPNNNFQASDAQFKLVAETLKKYTGPFMTCAEPKLKTPDDHPCLFIQAGCISERDLNIMGLPVPKTIKNPQNRHGCLCLGCKTELLENRHPCGHKCLYCYWRD